MGKTTAAQRTALQDLTGVFQLVSNRKRWIIIQYLHLARYATASVIERNCHIAQSTVSRHLRMLSDAGLLTKEKIGTSMIYQLNLKIWKDLSMELGRLSE